MFQAQMKALETIESEVQSSPDKQLSQTDPEARSMQHRGVALLAITFKPQWTRSITLSSRMK